MKDPELNDLDDLYFLAQLMARDETHAARLVEHVIAERAAGSLLPPGQLLAAHYPFTDSMDGPDLMRSRQIHTELQKVLPGLIGSASPTRRIAIYQAFTGESVDPVEKSTFMHRVHRALELQPNIQNPSAISERDVSVALTRFLALTLEPAPPSLRSALLSKYAPQVSSTNSLAARSRSPLQGKSSMAVKVAGSIIIILIASAIGTWIARPASIATGSDSGSVDMLDAIDRYAPNSDWAFEGSDPAQIERVLRDRTGLKIQVPHLDNGSLRGLSIEAVTSSLTLPVIHYDLDGTAVNVFVLDYSTIQSKTPEFDFDPEVLNQIAQPRGLDIQQLEVGSRMTFRNRDDVYITYTEGNPQELRNKFSFGS